MILDGKNVLITGAAVRLGRAIALELAGAGANILIHYRKSAREAKSLQKEIEALRCCAFLCPFDFGNASLLKIRSFVNKLPAPVDVLVNNAAIYYPTPLAKMTEDDWDDFLATNLKSPVFLARELGLKMAKRKEGVIINMTDIAGEKPFLNYLPYSISKAGMVAATRGLAKELAPFVRVNAVAPGPILEPPQGFSSPAQKKKIAEATLLKRFGNSDNIANAVRFLIENDFVTGEMIRVDGGKNLN
jgi:pteridine reductase